MLLSSAVDFLTRVSSHKYGRKMIQFKIKTKRQQIKKQEKFRVFLTHPVPEDFLLQEPARGVEPQDGQVQHHQSAFKVRGQSYGHELQRQRWQNLQRNE
jgi:hypothetical protein